MLAPLLLALGGGRLAGELALPALFSDGLVLQREARAPLWGRAAPLARVELRASWDERALSVPAGADGRFRFELETPAAGGPHTLSFASLGETLTLADVWLGDVWLAAGQSNMELTLAPGIGPGAEGWEQALATSADPHLRVFDVENAHAAAPLDDVRGRWLDSRPEHAGAFGAVPFFFARALRAELGVPIGVITATRSGSPAESWIRAEVAREFPELGTRGAASREPPREPATEDGYDPLEPSVLWNAMVAPLAPAALRGAIWYQGEANVRSHARYRRLFPALIADWRRAFGRDELPFYFVQLAPFAYPGDRGEAGLLRDAQRRALALPHTGMAVTMDIGDTSTPHPRRKREVGERLALWALADAYGLALEHSGPLFCSQRVERGAIRVDFEHGEGLTSRGEPVRHATIAGADGVFRAAEARIERDTLVVSSPEVPAPLAVRFGLGAADDTNLWNAAGLPAAAFRTDDWP